jgi:nitronate monooxygenase
MIQTGLTRMFDLAHPIMLAPMGSVAGGALAAAVSNAGGLGLVGGGYGNMEWLTTELRAVQRGTTRAWGVGFITWAIGAPVLRTALDAGPAALMLSFGDPLPYARDVKSAGCKLICQVQDLEHAKSAADAGADLIVAEGNEAGGHSGQRGTFALVPAVVDAVTPIPVVAAGGIADGRGLAASLMLGAQGALMGTRFYAAKEALGSAAAKERLVAASGDQTVRTSIFDIVRGYAWPAGFLGRALRNAFVERWHGSENELTGALAVEAQAYKAAASVADIETAVVWAGEAIDLIHSIESATELVRRISAEAEALLGSSGQWTS